MANRSHEVLFQVCWKILKVLNDDSRDNTLGVKEHLLLTLGKGRRHCLEELPDIPLRVRMMLKQKRMIRERSNFGGISEMLLSLKGFH